MVNIILPRQREPQGIRGLVQAWLINRETEKIKKLTAENFGNWQKNLTPNSYINDLVAANTGTSTDLEVKYCALSATYDSPQKTTSLEGEIFRKAYDSRAGVNNLLTVTVTFGASYVCPTTTINTVTDAKTFTLTDDTDFNVGYRFYGPDGEERKIAAKASPQITLDKDLISTPSGGETVYISTSRLHLVYGATATATEDTGSALSIAKLAAIKTAAEDLFCRWDITYLGS